MMLALVGDATGVAAVVVAAAADAEAAAVVDAGVARPVKAVATSVDDK